MLIFFKCIHYFKMLFKFIVTLHENLFVIHDILIRWSSNSMYFNGAKLIIVYNLYELKLSLGCLLVLVSCNVAHLPFENSLNIELLT